MALKFSEASAIPERRVRPIWDAIDSHRFKNALKLSQSLLIKHPNSPYAIALKALILERLGKIEEALSVCLSAKEKWQAIDYDFVDDLTLNTLQICFHRLGRFDLATSCYEYACVKQPHNKEMMITLFNCYVHEKSFVKQQQIAIKIYKLTGEEMFLLWAVCSIQLQVYSGHEGDKLLFLAEGLMKKHIAAAELHESEALLIYISLLEQQGRYSDAVEILSGNLGDLLPVEVDKIRMQGRLLSRAGNYSSAAKMFHKVLESCPDDWDCFLHYLDSLLDDNSGYGGHMEHDDILYPPKLSSCKLHTLTEEMFVERLSIALDFTHLLLQRHSNDVLRCPYMAIIEIERRRHLRGMGDCSLLLEALLQYVVRFGHFVSCASDIDTFSQVLTSDERIQFIESLKKISGFHSPLSTKSICQSLTFFKLEMLTGTIYSFSIDELVQRSIKMADIYLKSLYLSMDLDPQECFHGEEFLSMVCSVLVQLFWRTKKLGYLLEAVMVLEFGLNVWRHVWQYKILLVHLYSFLCAFTVSLECYKSLEIKNILLESVSHHIMPYLLPSPHWEESDNILNDYLKFMDGHLQESADLTIVAYQHRNYTKVIEFVRFKERLQRSYQYLIARVEEAILRLKRHSNNIDEVERVLEGINHGIGFSDLSEKLRNNYFNLNEDLQTRPWWTPTADENRLLESFSEAELYTGVDLHQLGKRREAKLQEIMGRRILIPRLIYLSIQCCSASVKENFSSNGSSSYEGIFADMKLSLQNFAQFLGFQFRNAVDMVIALSKEPNPSQVNNSNLVDIMNFSIFLNAWNMGGTCEHKLSDQDGCNLGTWTVVDMLFRRHILEKIRSMGQPTECVGPDLPIIVQLITESLSWHILVIQSYIQSSSPSGRKKKRNAPSDKAMLSTSFGIEESIKCLSEILEQVLNFFRKHDSEDENEQVETILDLLHSKDQHPEGPGKVVRFLEEVSVETTKGVNPDSWIAQGFKHWRSNDVSRKIVTGRSKLCIQVIRICESKLKLLQTLEKRVVLVQP